MTLADKLLRGYSWDDGLLVKVFLDEEVSAERQVIVIPKARRELIMEVAPKSSGHLSAKKVLTIMKKVCVAYNG